MRGGLKTGGGGGASGSLDLRMDLFSSAALLMGCFNSEEQVQFFIFHQPKL